MIEKRIEEFKKIENGLKSELINEIKSEFEKYNAIEVDCHYNLSHNEYEEIYDFLPAFYVTIDDYPDIVRPTHFVKEKDGLKMYCDADFVFDIDVTKNISTLSVYELHKILLTLQHPLVKKSFSNQTIK